MRLVAVLLARLCKAATAVARLVAGPCHGVVLGLHGHLAVVRHEPAQGPFQRSLVCCRDCHLSLLLRVAPAPVRACMLPCLVRVGVGAHAPVQERLLLLCFGNLQLGCLVATTQLVCLGVVCAQCAHDGSWQCTPGGGVAAVVLADVVELPEGCCCAGQSYAVGRLQDEMVS